MGKSFPIAKVYSNLTRCLQLATVASDTLMCMQTNYGLGKHMSNVDRSLWEGFFKV
jgi:hypothetical protein